LKNESLAKFFRMLKSIPKVEQLELTHNKETRSEEPLR
jgi:hypothetical protein